MQSKSAKSALPLPISGRGFCFIRFGDYIKITIEARFSRAIPPHRTQIGQNSQGCFLRPNGVVAYSEREQEQKKTTTLASGFSGLTKRVRDNFDAERLFDAEVQRSYLD